MSIWNAALTIDQCGLNPVGNINPVRIPAAAPVNLPGGTLTIIPGGSADFSQTFNAVNAHHGHISISAAQAPTGATGSLNIGNLTVSPDATVKFTGGNGGFLRQRPALNNSEIFITSINGVAIPANIPNKILGGWNIANNGEFASYVSAATPGSNNLHWGVTTMNGITTSEHANPRCSMTP